MSKEPNDHNYYTEGGIIVTKANSWVTVTTGASESKSNVHSVARIPNVGGKMFRRTSESAGGIS